MDIKSFFSWTRVKTIWTKPSDGFGDTVAKITKTFGINPCAGCERRRKLFNEKIAYRKQNQPK